MGKPEDAPKLEALKFAATVAVGTGGGWALWLAARRQRSTELALQEQARIAAEAAADRTKDLKQREAAAEDVRLDAVERRVTELYAKAAEQLGNDKAPVRMAGLYALDRLANDNPGHRQTIVDLICAYLRMPFKWDAPVLVGDGHPEDAADRELLQESQVRYTAQQILMQRLPEWSPADADGVDAFSVNLARAHLGDFRLRKVALTILNIDRAILNGHTAVTEGEIGSVWARGAQFKRDATFAKMNIGGATFENIATGDEIYLDECEVGSFVIVYRKLKPDEPASEPIGLTVTSSRFGRFRATNVVFDGLSSFEDIRVKSRMSFTACMVKARTLGQDEDFELPPGFVLTPTSDPHVFSIERVPSSKKKLAAPGSAPDQTATDPDPPEGS